MAAGTPQVGRHHQGVLGVSLQPPGELPGRRRLAGAVESDHQDDGGRLRRRLQSLYAAAEDRCQLLVGDLYDLLARREALEHVIAQGPLAYLADEVARDPEVDVGLQESHADLAQGRVHVLLREAALVAQPAEHAIQFFRQRLEHLLPFCLLVRDPLHQLGEANPFRQCSQLVIGRARQHPFIESGSGSPILVLDHCQ